MKGFMFEGKKILYCGHWNTHYKTRDDRMESNPDYWTKDLYYAPRLYKELILLSQKECLAFDAEHIGEIFFDYRNFCDEMRYWEGVDNDELTQLQIDYNELAKKHQLLVESNSKLMKKHDRLLLDYANVTSVYNILRHSNTSLWKDHDNLVAKHQAFAEQVREVANDMIR